MELKRQKFQGVLNILSFNRHFYVFGGIALALLILCHWVFGWLDYLDNHCCFYIWADYAPGCFGLCV
jgi:hypothetical protein